MAPPSSAARPPTSGAPATTVEKINSEAASAQGPRNTHSSNRRASSSPEGTDESNSRDRVQAAPAASQWNKGGLSGIHSPFSRWFDSGGATKFPEANIA